MTETLEKIRAKCIEANPDIVQELGMAPDAGDVYVEERPIRLADVLLATEKHLRDRFESQPDADLLANFQEGLWRTAKEVIGGWNLRNDDLEAQSPETVEFIGKVLGV